ncbi:MAG: sigma-70 family RNA polymerase sigma factor [Defluviitaleaceae bacterium]|nr:sigma-70 family RNA polymerase sigma factor [Defluviitaleaceae bacterium]MCL2238715.1 sigma-70 family RNA polymerase sigma factor [Defluviitaleaceae bacterium]
MDEIEKAYTLHARDVYRYLLSVTGDADVSEELTQETFFRAMGTIKQYDGRCALRVWLCQIAKHLWYQYLAKKKRHKGGELTEAVAGIASPEEAAMRNAEKTALYKAIHALPEPMREVVHMRLTGEFSFAEIGQILERSENWARVTFYRAKLKIVENMEGLT